MYGCWSFSGCCYMNSQLKCGHILCITYVVMHSMNDGNTYCLVCGGPLPEDTWFEDEEDTSNSDTWWQRRFIGIERDNIATELTCQYGGHFQFLQTYPKFHSRFHSAATYLLPPDLEEHQQGHGLICHTACYQLLHKRLKYKLQFQDVWQLLIDQQNATLPRMHGSSTLNDEYGGIAKYHGQVRSAHPFWFVVLLAISDNYCNPAKSMAPANLWCGFAQVA